MDLENIKSYWKDMDLGKKNQEQLLVMTKIKNHPKLKRIRIQFTIEAIFLLVFLALYRNAFDGFTKPNWANVLLISLAVAFILIRFIGHLILRNPVKEKNIRQSLTVFSKNLKIISVLTLITSFLFGLSVILFFIPTSDFTGNKYGILGGMFVTLIVSVILSGRIWLKRIKIIQRTVGELNDFQDL